MYGTDSYHSLVANIKQYAKREGQEVTVIQKNGEGEIIDLLHAARGVYDGIIINPGAYTHYSYAIHDAIKAISIDTVEVHISHIASRESFRHTSVTAPACVGQISGLGLEGYYLAMTFFAMRGRRV